MTLIVLPFLQKDCKIDFCEVIVLDKLKNKSFKSELPLHLMILPCLFFILVYSYGPMFGAVIAFQKFNPGLGFIKSQWVGWRNFEYIINTPGFLQILWNTIYIAFLKIVWGMVIPIVVALMLNETANKLLKRGIQTSLYLPYFLSWVILAGIIIDIFALKGSVNNIIGIFGVKPIFFLGDNRWFRTVLVLTETWKNFGFGTIIYMAAITSISPNLYEAAIVDGAGRWRQTWHITLPGMRTIIILLATLSLGSVLNAGFDQIFNLYSPMVYQTADIIDTFVYRLGIVQAQYGPSTAVGLFKSAVSLILISSSYYMAYKFAEYRIF